MSELAKAYLTMVPTSLLEAGHALVLVDEQGQQIGNQMACELRQSADTGDSIVTVSFRFDGKYVAWWAGDG